MKQYYSVTNESLFAVMEGLDIQSDDRVLAISGSGDQVLAMIEIADRVVAFDYLIEELGILRMKTKCIQEGDFDAFYNPGKLEPLVGAFPYRKEYFDVDRLERIRKRLGRLSYFRGDLRALPLIEHVMFTKIYLSNAIDFTADGHLSFCANRTYKSDNYSCLISAIMHLVDRLEVGGLAYTATDKSYYRDSLSGLFEHSPNMEIDKELTEVADFREHTTGSSIAWRPRVYRKIKRS